MRRRNWDLLKTILILVLSFVLCLFVEETMGIQYSIPAIFTLAVYLISLLTQGYQYGVGASLISVLAVNFAFTFPYFKFNFTIPENLFSAVIMLAVTITTSALTTKIRRQEKIQLEIEKEKMRANLLRAISHDLRTPLTTIYGASSAVIENYDKMSKEQHLELVEGIREDADWLTHMVENLLSVTRIDDGKVNLVTTPIVLSARYDERDKVNALDWGANDYITKPFGTAELQARIRSALRNSNPFAGNVIQGKMTSGDLIVDYDERKVSISGEELKLTQTEYNIVALLAKKAGKVLTYAEIIQSVWGSDDVGSTKKLQVNMANIRKKMGVKPGSNKYIQNELSIGYRMTID